ncbi:MAG: AsmA family protein [Gammaproteobacteria bacterium]|nr:AsmA family protein [Gammaproteobacteria bacterium]
MKGLLKILLGIVGLLVVLIVTAAIVIPIYVDPNDYKDEITTLAKKQTGRDLQMPGDLGITVFPWLGVQTGRLVLSNAEGFGEEPMVRAEGVEVRVKLLPLLRREIQMGTVVIDQMQANLARNENGVTNWDDLLKAAEEAPETDKPAEVAPADQKGFALAGLAVGGLDISNSRVTWDDRQAGQRYVIDELNLETGELVPGRPIDIDMSLALDASEPELKGTLSLTGTVSYDLDRQRYQVTPLKFRSSLEGPQLPGGAADISLDADTIAADLNANTASIKAFSLRALETTVEGDIDAQHIDRKLPGLKGYIQIAGDNLPALLRAAGKPELADKIQDDAAKFALNASFDADTDAGTARVSDLEARILGVDLSGDLNATNTNTDNPGINGRLDIAGDDLGSLLAVAGQEPLAQNLKSLKASASLSGTRQSLKLEPLEAEATVAGDALPEGPVDIKLNATADANLAEETLRIPKLSVQGLGLDVQGNVNASGIIERARV